MCVKVSCKTRLPFAFCAICPNIVESPMVHTCGNSTYWLMECENEPICKRTIEFYERYKKLNDESENK